MVQKAKRHGRRLRAEPRAGAPDSPERRVGPRGNRPRTDLYGSPPRRARTCGGAAPLRAARRARSWRFRKTARVSSGRSPPPRRAGASTKRPHAHRRGRAVRARRVRVGARRERRERRGGGRAFWHSGGAGSWWRREWSLFGTRRDRLRRAAEDGAGVRARRRNAARKLPLSRDASASAAAVVAGSRGVPPRRGTSEERARAAAGSERSAEEAEKKSVSPRRGAATTRRRTLGGFHRRVFERSIGGDAAVDGAPTTRAPHIASDGEASGGAAGFAAVSSLASRLAKLGARARDAPPRSPAATLHPGRLPRVSRRRGLKTAVTRTWRERLTATGSISGDSRCVPTTTRATSATRRRGDGGGREQRRVFVCARDGGGARGVATRRNAAAGRAPPERRAFASLLAEGAAVAAKQAGTYGQSQEAKVGRRARRGAGIAADGCGGRSSWTGSTTCGRRPRTRTRWRRASPWRTTRARWGSRTAEPGTAAAAALVRVSGSSVDALAESVLLKLRDRKERKLAIRHSETRTPSSNADHGGPRAALELAPTTHARGNAETRNRSFGGKRRFDGVPDRDVVRARPFASSVEAAARAAELTAGSPVARGSPRCS